MANDLIKEKGQSFWDTKEGTTGMVFGVGILGLLGYGAYKIMPYIVDLLQNTVYAIGLGVVAVALIWALVIDDTLRNRSWLVYKMLMHKLTYSIIKWDPFGVLREMQERSREKREMVNKHRQNVKAQSTTIRRELEAFQDEKEKVQSQVRWLQKNGKSEALISDEASKLGQLDASITRMTKSYDVIEGFYAQMTRIYEELERFDKRVEWDISMREREYKAINATNTAMQIMRAAIKGTDGDSQMRDQTLAFLTTDYGDKLGRIESAMEDTAKFLEQADMQNAMYADRGMKLLEDLKGRDLSVGLLPGKVATPVSVGGLDYFNKK